MIANSYTDEYTDMHTCICSHTTVAIYVFMFEHTYLQSDLERHNTKPHRISYALWIKELFFVFNFTTFSLYMLDEIWYMLDKIYKMSK